MSHLPIISSKRDEIKLEPYRYFFNCRFKLSNKLIFKFFQLILCKILELPLTPSGTKVESLHTRSQSIFFTMLKDCLFHELKNGFEILKALTMLVRCKLYKITLGRKSVTYLLLSLQGEKLKVNMHDNLSQCRYFRFIGHEFAYESRIVFHHGNSYVLSVVFKYFLIVETELQFKCQQLINKKWQRQSETTELEHCHWFTLQKYSRPEHITKSNQLNT